MQRPFPSLHRSKNDKSNFNVLRNSLVAVQLILHLLVEAILLLDILLFLLLYRLFNLNYFLIEILSSILGPRGQVSNSLILLLHLDQAHDGTIIALTKEDIDYLLLVLLGLLQALDLLRLFFDHFFKMLPE